MKKTKLLVMLVLALSCIFTAISFADVIIPEDINKSAKAQTSELTIDCGKNGYYTLNNEPKNNGITSYTFTGEEREYIDVTIWANAGYRGSVTIKGQKPDERNTIVVDHIPEEGIEEPNWNDHMVFYTLKQDTTITVTFTKEVTEEETPTVKTHRITTICNTSGEIYPEGSGDVNEGESVTIEFAAHEGYKLGEILLDGKSVSATKLTNNEGTEGYYTLSKVKADHEITIVFIESDSQTTPVVTPTPKPEATYEASEWAIPEMEKADEANLIPSELRSSNLTKNVSRTEFAKICVSLYDAKANEELKAKNQDLDETNPFTDVDDADVTRAFRLGITQGVGDNKFDPNSNITREQMATMLYRLAGTLEIELTKTEENSFTDSGEVSDWAADSVNAMSGAGIIKGMGDGTFAPKGTATREQAIAIANRLNDK